VLLATSIPLAFHYNTSVYDSFHVDRWVYLHRTLFVIVNLLLFFIWEETKADVTDEKPWFVIPFFSLAIFYIIHHCRHFYPGDKFKLHLFLFIDGNLLLFFIWGFAGRQFPWFAFPLLVWIVVLLIHYKVHKKNAPPADSSSPGYEPQQGDNRPIVSYPAYSPPYTPTAYNQIPSESATPSPYYPAVPAPELSSHTSYQFAQDDSNNPQRVN